MSTSLLRRLLTGRRHRRRWGYLTGIVRHSYPLLPSLELTGAPVLQHVAGISSYLDGLFHSLSRLSRRVRKGSYQIGVVATRVCGDRREIEIDPQPWFLSFVDSRSPSWMHIL